MIDLGAELLAALRSPDGRAALAEAVRPVVAGEVRAALDEKERDVLLDAKQAAAFLSLSAAAFKMRRRRDQGLDALGAGDGRFRRWRRSDLETWLRNKGRAVERGGR